MLLKQMTVRVLVVMILGTVAAGLPAQAQPVRHDGPVALWQWIGKFLPVDHLFSHPGTHPRPASRDLRKTSGAADPDGMLSSPDPTTSTVSTTLSGGQ